MLGFLRKRKDRKEKRKGQSTAEYVIIVVLVAIASIGVITVFGNTIRDLFRASAEQLGGDASAAPDASISSQAAGEVNKDMDTW